MGVRVSIYTHTEWSESTHAREARGIVAVDWCEEAYTKLTGDQIVKN